LSARSLAVAAVSLAVFVSTEASAQLPGVGGGGGAGAPKNAPTQSGPVQNRQVGPRAGGSGDDDDSNVSVTQRAEPVVQAPTNPLEMSPELRAKIGSDWAQGYAAPREGAATMRSFHFPFYEERKGDYHLRLMLPPFAIERTRGLPDPDAPGPLVGIPTHPDEEDLYGLFYYRRRSEHQDADVLFPLAWHMRSDDSYTTVIGPVVHREAPGENDNWLAPLYFAGARKDGGYFHMPLLLTTSHFSPKGAFTIAGPYFRDREGTDVDMGVAPFFFHGDNGNLDGNGRTYTLIPPLLYYHREHEIDESSMTVIGPVVMKSSPKRDIFDVAPLFFHIKGKPETGGVEEEHTTLFPLFHWGHSPDRSLFVMPGYLRRQTKTADTMLTPFFSHAETRNGATSFTVAGPVLPVYWRYTDRDLGTSALGIFPFFYNESSPAGHDFLTPLFGRFETYGVSRTYWAFPSIKVSTDTHGWSANVYPFVFTGRNDESSHTVIAPVFWDFANPHKRTTIAFPAYWRFADTNDGTVTQVAGNTVYMEKKVAGGTDWQFHFVPLFSYGQSPEGSWWNVLFGLAGYDRTGPVEKIKAFWIPITIAGPPAAQLSASSAH
jgi:hypothetical protein